MSIFIVRGASVAAAADWPNEPVGFSLLTDNDFSSEWGTGWNSAFSAATIESDVTAPLSPNSVMEMAYPIDYVGGGSPDNIYYGAGSWTNIYFGYWWKPSNPWDNHSSAINKINFMTGDSDDFYIDFYNANTMEIQCQFSDATNTHITANRDDGTFTGVTTGITLGQWHQIECIFQYSTTTTSEDGVIKLWLDDTLEINSTEVNFPSASMYEFQFSPTWGGIGDAKTSNDYYRYDHVRIGTF